MAVTILGMVRRAGRGCLFVVVALIGVGVLAMLIPGPPLTPRLPPVQRPDAANSLPWLSARSGKIVDERGRTVLLRGYNVEALLEYPDHRAAPLDDQDGALMAQAGVDVARLPISWSLLEPTRGQLDNAYLERIVAAVQLLNRHHIYVIPDMHIYPNWGPAYGGAGAPRWAGFPGLPDIPGVPENNIRKNLSPGANVAATYFWASADWQRDFLACWRAVAVRLRDMSGVAGYDLYNEPRPGPMPPPVFEKYWMWPLMSRAIEAVGSVDPNHLFIVESTLFADLPTWTIPINAANVVYSPHVYTGILVPPHFNGNRDRMTDEMAERRREAEQMSAPLWVGELGDDHNALHGVEWADAILDVFDDLDAGWAWWVWRQDDDNWRIRSFDGAAIDTRFLPHLARPYLAAAPAGIHAGRGDGTRGRISITVAADHDEAPVEVAWSTLTLPRPRAAGTCLSSVAWENERYRLLLSLVPGSACTVEVAS